MTIQPTSTRVLRSSIVSLSTETLFACNLTYTISYMWTMLPATIDLSLNPTSFSPGLVIQANTLFYGFFEFTLQVQVTLTSTGQTLSNNQTQTIEIVPTGVAVFGLQNGISGITIGSQQALSLNPTLYSIDLDNLISPSSLVFTFFCSILGGTSTSLDLWTYKSNGSLAMNSNQTCFESNSDSFIF